MLILVKDECQAMQMMHVGMNHKNNEGTTNGKNLKWPIKLIKHNTLNTRLAHFLFISQSTP